MHQLVIKQNFYNIKIHGTKVKITVKLHLRYIYYSVYEDFPTFIVPNWKPDSSETGSL